MNNEDKGLLKEKILEEIEGLKKNIAFLEEMSKPVAPDAAIGRLTRMEAINSKSINDINLKSAKNRLSRLQSALNRIDGENFGICVNCGEPIPVKRLMIIPESLKCVECMEE